MTVSWGLNGICASLVHHPPATVSVRSATGCVVHGSALLPTTSPTRDDETRHVGGSVHGICWTFVFCEFLSSVTRWWTFEYKYASVQLAVVSAVVTMSVRVLLVKAVCIEAAAVVDCGMTTSSTTTRSVCHETLEARSDLGTFASILLLPLVSCVCTVRKTCDQEI